MFVVRIVEDGCEGGLDVARRFLVDRFAAILAWVAGSCRWKRGLSRMVVKVWSRVRDSLPFGFGAF